MKRILAPEHMPLAGADGVDQAGAVLDRERARVIAAIGAGGVAGHDLARDGDPQLG